MAIPGVVSVGFGWKERGGEVLAQLAYRVYVRAKRPLAEVAPDTRIPSEIGGIATDVHVSDDRAVASDQIAFVTPGCQITRYIPGKKMGSGTLTLLVDKGGKHYALSCDHVLDAGKSLTGDALDVYSPLHTSCDCRVPFAAVQRVPVQGAPDGDPVPGSRLDDVLDIGGKKFLVDAALAAITSKKATGSNLITLPNGSTVTLDQGLIDYSSLASTNAANPDTPAHGNMRVVTTPPTVNKLGSVTRLTTGKVVQLSAVRTFEASTHPAEVIDVWELTVTPSPGMAWTQDYQLAPEAVVDPARWNGKPVTATMLPGNKIRLSGQVFALPGDSGSPVWDDSRKLVGIVTKMAGVDATIMVDGEPTVETLPNGLATLQYAPATFQALGLTAASILAPGVQLRGETVEVPRARPLFDLREAAAVRRAVQETEGGRHLLALVTRHLESVTELVHHRRRVKIVWHRNQGPAFALAFVAAMREPARSLPEEIAGVTLEHALEQFIGVLKLEGDESLARDLERHGAWVAALLLRKQSMGDLLASLSTPASVTAA